MHAQDKAIARSAEVCAELGCPNRLEIVRLLHNSPLNVGAIVSALGNAIAQPTVSRHLHRLRMARIVECERRRQEMVYRLCSPLHPCVFAALDAAGVAG